MQHTFKNLNGKTVLLLAAFILTASASVTTAEDNSTAVDTIKTRQEGFKSLGAASKTIRDELRGGADTAKIKAAADDIHKAATAMTHWFPSGSGPEAGVKTEAKPEIWTDAAGFTEVREAFVREAGKFAQTAQTGDVDAVNAGMRDLGQRCKGCHEKFRVKKN